MIILNWLVLGPFGLQGTSGARDSIISNAIVNDLVGETTIAPTQGSVSAGKTWLLLNQSYPDLVIVANNVANGFMYDESSKTYVGNVLYGNNMTGALTVKSLSDLDVQLTQSNGAVLKGKVTDAIHIAGTSSNSVGGNIGNITRDNMLSIPGVTKTAWLHNQPSDAVEYNGEGYTVDDFLYLVNSGTLKLSTPLVFNWDGYEFIDMTKYMSPVDRAVYYAFTYVYSPTAQSARLLVRSDDDCRIWLNASKVYGTDAITGFAGRKVNNAIDRTNITLNAGWNTLLVKVVNSGGPTGFAVCIADTADMPLTNLAYSTNAVTNTTTGNTTSTTTNTTTSDAALIAFLNSQPSSSLGSTWRAGMTASEYMATLTPSEQAAVTQAMYAGNTALPPAPQSEVLASATDSLISKGWGVTAQMVFYAALGIVVILIAIFLL